MPSSSSSSSDKCPICLEIFKGEAFLEPCFHRFCFHCILQWSEMIWATRSPGESLLQLLDCPLCKIPCAAAIHDIIGPSFDRHQFFPPRNVAEPKFRLSTEHYCRLRVYYPQNLVTLPPDSDSPPNDLVRPGIAQGSTSVPPRRAVERCRTWVRRELQALLREDDVDLLVHHFAGILEHFQTCKPSSPLDDWKSVLSLEARRFIGDRAADTFVNELEKFLVSGLNIQAYDKLQSGE